MFSSSLDSKVPDCYRIENSALSLTVSYTSYENRYGLRMISYSINEAALFSAQHKENSMGPQFITLTLKSLALNLDASHSIMEEDFKSYRSTAKFPARAKRYFSYCCHAKRSLSVRT